MAVLLAFEVLFRLFGEIVGTDVTRCPRVIDHVGIGIDANRLEERRQADTVDGFTDTFMLKRIVGKELHHLTGKLGELLVVLVGLHFHERHDHGAHQVTDLERPLAADQDADTLVVTR